MDILLIVVVVFVLFAWSRALLRFKEKAIRINEFIFWTCVWASLVVLTIFRTKLSIIADVVGVQRPLDAIIYFSIVITLYLIFRLYVKIESVEQNVTKVVREIAIQGKKQK